MRDSLGIGGLKPSKSGTSEPRLLSRPPFRYNTPEPVSTSSPESPSFNERWSFVHALVTITATALAAWMQTVTPLLLAGLVTFSILVVGARGRWTPGGSFGAANSVTAVRLGLLGLLPSAAASGPAVLIALSLLILALDGVDGWLARRYDSTTEFGAFFDKETDALFLLLLTGLSTFQGPLPLWIVGAGLLRYGFVVLLFAGPAAERTESRSTLARYVYGFMVAALLSSFLPYSSLYQPLVLAATAGLLVSFGRSLSEVARAR